MFCAQMLLHTLQMAFVVFSSSAAKYFHTHNEALLLAERTRRRARSHHGITLNNYRTRQLDIYSETTYQLH